MNDDQLKRSISRRQWLKSAVVLIFSLFPKYSFSAIAQPLPGKPKHHTNNGFRNYPLVPPPARLGASFYWNRMKRSLNKIIVPTGHFLSEAEALASYSGLQAENTITWIGQASFLIKVDGKVILTDPFFDEYTDPFGFIQRFRPPGITAKNLPPIDAIVISHNHRDHLSEGIIESLPDKERIQVFVPLKLKPFFKEKGYIKINEMDWYESASMGGLQLTALPAVHYSGRSLWDRDKTLWCSWAISSKATKIYFSGDTAYSSTLFKEVGKKIGPVDLSLLAIGTYGNKKYGVNNHADPEEAVKIGIEIGTNIFVGMHWGTLDLSDEPPWEPPDRFINALQNVGVAQDRGWVLKIGETRAF